MAIPVSIQSDGTFADYVVAPAADRVYIAKRIRCGILDIYRFPTSITLYKTEGHWKSDSFNQDLTLRLGNAIDEYNQ